MKKLPILAVVLIDFLVFAICLLTFSYFHHVRPHVVTEVSEVSVDKPHRFEESSEAEESDDSYTSYPGVIELSGDESDPFAISEDESDPAESSVEDSETPSDETNAESSGPPSPPAYRPSVLEILERTPTAYVYHSDDISVEITELKVATPYGESICHFADIHISMAENLRTVLANNQFGTVRESTLSMSNRVGAIVTINGDYYGNSSEAYGAVIRNGVLYNKKPDNTDLMVMYYDGTMKAFSRERFDADTEMQAGAYQSWDFGPSLLDDGRPYSNVELFGHTNIPGANPRTVIGYFSPGHYCFLTVNGRKGDGISVGLRMEDLADLMSLLGCKAAYNLDGGGTSVMVFQGQIVNTPCNGKPRACSDALSIVEFGGN